MNDIDEIHVACDLVKNKIREAMKEFVDSDIHSDRDMQYFAVINVMTVVIKDVVNIFTPDVGPHEFCGFLSRLGENYHRSCELIDKMPKDEDGEIHLTKENMAEVLKALKQAVKKD